MARGAIYTCTVAGYDTIVSPVVATPGCDHLMFSDRRQPLTPGWRFRPLPEDARTMPGNEANRYCKMFHDRILPDHDYSIYLDGNILIISDLSPLIEEFLVSDCDIALFDYRRPGWSVLDDMNLALSAGRIHKDRRGAFDAQMRDYAERRWLELPVTENAVIFRRHGRPALDRLMSEWWAETSRYTMRDQFTLPGLLLDSSVTVHRWNWHYTAEDNGYFSPLPHKRASVGAWAVLSDLQFGSLMRARYSRRDRILQRGIEAVRRAGGRAPVPDHFLAPAATPKKRGN